MDGQRAALLLDRRVVVPLPHVAERGGQAGCLGDGEDLTEALPDVLLAEQADPADFQDGQPAGERSSTRVAPQLPLRSSASR